MDKNTLASKILLNEKTSNEDSNNIIEVSLSS